MQGYWSLYWVFVGRHRSFRTFWNTLLGS